MSSKIVFSLTVDQAAALKSARHSVVTAEPRCMTAMHQKGLTEGWSDGTLTPFGELAAALVKGLPKPKARS